jgi:hypothetical protein
MPFTIIKSVVMAESELHNLFQSFCVSCWCNCLVIVIPTKLSLLCHCFTALPYPTGGGGGARPSYPLGWGGHIRSFVHNLSDYLSLGVLDGGLLVSTATIPIV